METIEDLGKYTFPALLKNSVKKFGDRPALTLIGGTPDTYETVQKKSIMVSKALEALGFAKGNKIALFGTGRPQWGESFFGIVNQGMIAIPLLPDFSATEVKAIFEHCGVDALIVEDKLYEKLKDADFLPKTIIKMNDFTFISGGEGSLEQFESNQLKEVEVEEDDTCSIIYTSGTTGRSKGVELSHKNLVWNGVMGQCVRRINKYDRCLSFLPISHVYEFTVDFTMQMLNGSCVYYLGKPPVVSALLPAFKIVKPTIVCSVPLVVEKIYKAKVLPTFTKNKFISSLYGIPLFRKILHRVAGKQLKKTFGGSLNFFGIGGAKVDPVVERFLYEGKFPYAMGYGLTETSPLLAACNPSDEVLGYIGPMLQGIELKICNPDPETGIGEVVAKSQGVMKGYYKDPELTKTVFTTEEDSVGPGWFKTGDLGTLDKKKGKVRLALKGRSKNMILGPSGENIYPEDIEFVLNQHPLVSESLVVEDDSGLVALVTVDEEKLEAEVQERVKKGIVEGIAEKVGSGVSSVTQSVAYQKEAILNEIQFFVNQKVNKSSHINKVEKVNEFEKTASQKIKRYLYNRKSDDSNKKK